MRVDHDYFARAGKCAKKHEQVLAALPRQSFGRDREHVRTQRAQRFQTFQMTAGFKLRPRDEFDFTIRIELDQLVLPARPIAAECEENNFHPRTLRSTNTSANVRPVLA